MTQRRVVIDHYYPRRHTNLVSPGLRCRNRTAIDIELTDTKKTMKARSALARRGEIGDDTAACRPKPQTATITWRTPPDRPPQSSCTDDPARKRWGRCLVDQQGLSDQRCNWP